jgi:1,4-dihydroxy-2-naphthoate octaprenyltransferase
MNKIVTLFLASRPKTLLVSFCCWLSVSSLQHAFSIPALLLAIGLQIWANWVNDYLDFMNGIDHALRQGPTRWTSRLTPSFMKIILCLWCCLLFVCASYFKMKILVGILILIAWFYSAWLGFAGEWLSFFACGPLATYLFSSIYQVSFWQWDLLLLSIINGSWSAALLMANNMRDRISDTHSPKKSTCVWFGQDWASMQYQMFILMCIWCLFAWLIFRPSALRLCMMSLTTPTALLYPTLSFIFRYCFLFSFCASYS